MGVQVKPDGIYMPSEDVVFREIEGELLIVPLVAGIGDMEDELFTLNEIGKIIWDRLDGQKNLGDIVAEISLEFEAPAKEIEEDVTGFVHELVRRGILVEAPGI